MNINEKITKKDMDKIDVSTHKGGEMNLEEQKKIYLGGDDEPLEGFLNDDDVIDFDKLSKNNQSKSSSSSSSSIFGRLTSAFKNVTGNKVLEEKDIEPILKDLQAALMEKNVALEVAEKLCKSVLASLVDKKTNNFTTVQTTVKNALVDSI